MTLLSTEIEITQTVENILIEADHYNADVMSFNVQYRGHHACVVVLCGPDTKAYLQALDRSQNLLAEDAKLLENEDFDF